MSKSLSYIHPYDIFLSSSIWERHMGCWQLYVNNKQNRACFYCEGPTELHQWWPNCCPSIVIGNTIINTKIEFSRLIDWVGRGPWESSHLGTTGFGFDMRFLVFSSSFKSYKNIYNQPFTTLLLSIYFVSRNCCIIWSRNYYILAMIAVYWNIIYHQDYRHV